MKQIWEKLRLLLIIAVSVMMVFPRTNSAFAAELGAEVTNIASVSFSQNGQTSTLSTGSAVFTIEARRTPSVVEFFRILPGAPDAFTAQLNGSDYLSLAGFSPVTGVTRPDGTPVVAGSSLALSPATSYFAGEPVIIRVTDVGQNGDPTRIENIEATIVTTSGDQVTLRLYESGPDTGEFYAYIQLVRGGIDTSDDTLSTVRGDILTARYQDPFDATEVSLDTAGVDPFGRLFDSATGAFIDGVAVTIVDAATGLPAQVFGIDGSSVYPSTVTTGGTVTDASGVVYNLDPGEFRFPIMFPGEYRLSFTPPDGYAAPSVEPSASLAALPTAPFTILDASYGGSFLLTSSGDVSFDVPLDPRSTLVVRKSSSVATAAIGDFVRYRIDIQNDGATDVRLRIRDVLPRGFRYQTGSAAHVGVGGARIVLPAPEMPISETLIFDAGVLGAGANASIEYFVRVGPDVAGEEAINRAAVINGAGGVISNTAEAAISLRDDFLRDTMTIIGRVAEDACNPDDPWPRKIDGGNGIAGVRLYMETGAYVLTDEDGLFHFEAVTPKTHVVQLDEITIPEGYEAVACEASTRYAGSTTSKFVEGVGGSVRRANFYLKQRHDFTATISENAPQTNEETTYDNEWLSTQSVEPDWAYPAAAFTPENQSVNIGVRHATSQRATLELNGRKVGAVHFGGRDVNAESGAALTKYRGIDLLEGVNRVTAIIADLDGNEVARLERNIDYITRLERVELVAAHSMLIANGRDEVVIAIRATDGAGRPVHRGRMVQSIVAPPFRAADLNLLENQLPIDAPQAALSASSAENDGVVRVRLAPTTEAGAATISIKLDNGVEQEVTVYLKPELREWIVVGLAEGGLQKRVVNGPAPKAADLLRDGRVAVFAKGAVKGGWLVTAAGDTDKRRGAKDDDLFDQIDPDERYGLYGDRSNQAFEAQSRYPVFLKAEKDAFQAMIGDYDTGLNDARLTRYARRLTGARASYLGDIVDVTAFASDTNQRFVKDEIAADGTSGPFALTQTPIVRNSETIIVETRNRFRPDETVSALPLVRYADYDIDYDTGVVILRLPLAAADAQFNPNIIVVDYETSAVAQRSITAGGRAGVNLLDDRLSAHVAGIHEGGDGGENGDATLLGADMRLQLREGTDLRVEYAASKRERSGQRQNGEALAVEAIHVTERVNARAYFDQVGEDFGLNQQTSAVAGIRRYGAEVSVKIDDYTNDDVSRRGERFVDVKGYREENLRTGASRTVAEGALRQEDDVTSGSIGLRWVAEENAAGEERQSLLGTVAASQRFKELGLNIRASRDQPITGEGGSSLFPARTTLGFDQNLFDAATLSVTHEIQNGVDVKSANTIVGLSSEPWNGGQVTIAADRLTQDSGERIGATFGVDQQVRLNKEWSASFGVSRREALKSSGAITELDDIVPDETTSPFEVDASYTSVFSGLGYRGKASTGSARFEMKKSTLGQRHTGVFGAAREVSSEFSFAGAGRFTQENNDLSPDRRTGEVRIGGAWRPRDSESLVAFNRLDIKVEETDADIRSFKVVHNTTLNARLAERLHVAANHGIKYASIEAGGYSFSGLTSLVGGDLRFDLTEWLDIGAQGSAIYDHGAGSMAFSYGPSLGVSPADNIWLSIGYNLEGFEDPDFASADWSTRGPFIRLRLKFDQHTASGLLNAISPTGVN